MELSLFSGVSKVFSSSEGLLECVHTVYMHTHRHTHTHTLTERERERDMYMYIYIYIYTHTRTYWRVYAHTCAHIPLFTHLVVNVYM